MLRKRKQQLTSMMRVVELLSRKYVGCHLGVAIYMNSFNTKTFRALHHYRELDVYVSVPGVTS